MRTDEKEVRIAPPEPPFDLEVMDRLIDGLSRCPDLAFAHLCQVTVVDEPQRSSRVLFAWLIPPAVHSLRSALNLVSEIVATALPEETFLDVAILNSAPELLEDVEAAGCLIVERDPNERRRALTAAHSCRTEKAHETDRRRWWRF